MGASTILGIGVMGYGAWNVARGLGNSSFPGLVSDVAVVGSSLIAGAWLGFMGGLAGGVGIALLSDKVGSLEGNIRKRFARNII